MSHDRHRLSKHELLEQVARDFRIIRIWLVPALIMFGLLAGVMIGSML